MNIAVKGMVIDMRGFKDVIGHNDIIQYIQNYLIMTKKNLRLPKGESQSYFIIRIEKGYVYFK